MGVGAGDKYAFIKLQEIYCSLNNVLNNVLTKRLKLVILEFYLTMLNNPRISCMFCRSGLPCKGLGNGGSGDRGVFVVSFFRFSLCAWYSGYRKTPKVTTIETFGCTSLFLLMATFAGS